MIVLRFKVRCRSDKAEELAAAFAEVVAPAREVEGVVSFDIARDLADPNAFIAVEVFQDQAARERQESLPQVGKVMAMLPTALIAPPEMDVYEVAAPVPA
jgi:quinol monooxygenase YgiN